MGMARRTDEPMVEAAACGSQPPTAGSRRVSHPRDGIAQAKVFGLRNPGRRIGGMVSMWFLLRHGRYLLIHLKAAQAQAGADKRPSRGTTLGYGKSDLNRLAVGIPTTNTQIARKKRAAGWSPSQGFKFTPMLVSRSRVSTVTRTD